MSDSDSESHLAKGLVGVYSGGVVHLSPKIEQQKGTGEATPKSYPDLKSSSQLVQPKSHNGWRSDLQDINASAPKEASMAAKVRAAFERDLSAYAPKQAPSESPASR